MDINKIRVITIACRIISVAVLVGVAVWAISGGMFFGRGMGSGFSNFHGSLDVESSQSVSAQGVRSLSIDWVAGHVDVMPWDGNEIRITEFSAQELRESEALQLRTQDGVIAIEFMPGRLPRGNVAPKDLEVLIPRGLAGELEKFSANGMFAGIAVSGIDADVFVVSSVSGRVSLSDIDTTRLGASTTSGSIELLSVSADAMDLGSISGRVELTGTQARRLDVETVSGRHELYGAFEQISLTSVSGRVNLTSITLPADLRVNTVSGRVAITVPDEGGISVQHSSASGRLSSEIPMVTGSDAQFNIATVSGRVDIYALQ